MMKETEHLLYPEISMADAVMRLPYDGLLASSAPSQAELEMWKRKTKTTTMSNQLIVGIIIGIIIGALRLIGKIEIYPWVFYSCSFSQAGRRGSIPASRFSVKFAARRDRARRGRAKSA